MKAHRTDKVSLTFSIIFLVVAAWWLVAQIIDLALPAVGWFVAGALIVFGILGLLGALRANRGTATQPVSGTAEGPASAPPDEPVTAPPGEPVIPQDPAAGDDDRS